jgi:hypothetical protein
MPEIKTDWSYPVMETTLDKRVEKPGVQQGFSSEMTGVDGRSEGGLKPFPGFQLVYTLSALRLQSGHSTASRILDFRPVDFRIGSEYYGYGFVYRAQRTTGNLCDVFIDYWNSVENTWSTCVKLMDGVSKDAQFDVEVAGRFVYTFASGRSPALFYVDATRTKEYFAEFDTYLRSDTATTNYGTAATLELQGGGATTRNILFRFATENEADKTVESATLEFTVSGNAMVAGDPSSTVRVNPVTDPGATGQLWESTTATWNLRKTAVNWQTAGGTWDGSIETTTTIPVGFFGRVSMNVKDAVQAGLSSVTQSFTDKVDLIVRGSTSNRVLSVAAVSQGNLGIRPKLTVTYSDKVFLTPVIVGEDPAVDPIPGPGKQPTLKSPERGISPGSFTSIESGVPASAQIVLVSDNPYSNEANFPNPVSGLCVSDTFPAPASPTVPGTSPGAHTPTAGACSAVVADPTTSAGLTTQLLTPANKQTGVSVTPRLDWTSYYADGQALSPNMVWDVYLVEEGKGVLGQKRVASGLTVSYYEPGQLWPGGKMPYGKKFLWKVVAKRMDCDDFFVESMTASFTTEEKFLARKFEPGDYSFGYVLVDSKTGRRSAFSEVAQARSEDFLVARIQGGNTISVKQDQFMGVEIVYDSAKYDLMYVYRSVKIQDAGGTMMAGLPFLDAVVTLQDYQTCKNGDGGSYTFNTATTTLRHAMYFYELEDKQLVYQTPYTDRSVFDEQMPFGGAAAFYQNTMLVSRIEAPPKSTTVEDRPEDVTRGLGEMRWSSLMELSPELFPPFNRYNPTIPSNEVITFVRAGGNMLGMSRDKVYHIRKSGPYIKVTEMHEGYGVANQRAVDSVGSAAYFVTSHGLKAVDMQGQLDEIRNLNSVMVREWRSDLLSVEVAHDPLMNCLFVLNPVQEETYVLWFSSGKTTKIADTTFAHVTQGPWPSNWTEGTKTTAYRFPLTRRAFFLEQSQETRTSGTGLTSYPGPRIYVVDSGAVKTISGGSAAWNTNRRITTLDFSGDSRFVASGAFNTLSLSVPVSVATGTTVPSGAWQFAYVYLVHSTANPGNVGKKAKVMWNNTTNVFFDTTKAEADWVKQTVAGDVFVVSPVVFEWAGHPLGMQTDQGMVFSNADFFRVKIASSVGAAFTDVAGPPLVDSVTATKPLAQFFGLLYSGTGDVPERTARTLNGDGQPYKSVQDGEGMVYAAFGSDSSDGRYGAKGTSLNPGIRILCPDLDFRLLGCIVRGTITNVERTSNHRGS